MSSDVENVKVAVRVRPFNSREKQRHAKCIIEMHDQTTILFNPSLPSEEPKKFTFDFSYWSHDGFTQSAINDSASFCQPDPNQPNGFKYADQERVYEDLGKDLLRNAFDGYNCALFAYGQTGSGKSYTIIGYGANKGIVPRFCEELFETINHRAKNGKQNTLYEVKCSMLEIYNEVVQDLLSPSSDRNRNKRGLRVREHPTNGFYAEGLKTFAVTNKKDIIAKIDEGTTNRSIASTNMNETSSRAHTIVQITLIQRTKTSSGGDSTKTSNIHLVDLAGSERLSGTDATGDRLKEGVSINQSLACLGNCIHALAETSSGSKNIRIPYRESALTRLLMNALGGNSKTVMIATISPADINYGETLSTLRYADRAKEIRVHAKINQSQTDKIIHQLREENNRLMKMIASAQFPDSLAAEKTPSVDVEELRRKWEEETKATMAENERQLREMKESYEEKLKTQMDRSVITSSLTSLTPSLDSMTEQKLNNPYLSNLNFDEQLSGKIVHIINVGTNTIGKDKSSSIMLYGPKIHDHHGTIYRRENGLVLLEAEDEDSRILLNGDRVTTKVSLNHHDRILFGTTQLFVFIHPEQEKKAPGTYSEVTFELAQEEIASKAGYTLDNEDQTMEVAILNKDLMEVLPGIDEANGISDELDRNTRFEVMLVAPQILGKNSDRTEVYVKVVNVEMGTEFEWTKEKFLDRLYLMKEMYQNYESQDEWEVPIERDPFYDDPSNETLIGTTQLYLQPLAYLVEIKEQLELIDYRRMEVGIINVEVVPSSESGVEYTENDDIFVDSPSELIGRRLYFVVKINGCRGLPARFTDVYCSYHMFLEKNQTRTDSISDTSNPDFNHRKMFSFNPVTSQLVDYLKEGSLCIQVFGKQIPRKSYVNRSTSRGGPGGGPPRALLNDELVAQTNNMMDGFKMNGRIVEPSQQSIIVELLLMKKQQARQQQRIENLKKLVEASERYKKRDVPVQMVKDILSTTTQDVAEDIISQIPSNQEYRKNKSSVCVIL